MFSILRFFGYLPRVRTGQSLQVSKNAERIKFLDRTTRRQVKITDCWVIRYKPTEVTNDTLHITTKSVGGQEIVTVRNQKDRPVLLQDNDLLYIMGKRPDRH